MDTIEKKFDPTNFAEELRQHSRKHQAMINDVNAFFGTPKEERPFSYYPEADSELIGAVVEALRDHSEGEQMGEIIEIVDAFFIEVISSESLEKQVDFWKAVSLILLLKTPKDDTSREISEVGTNVAAAVKKTV